MTHGPLYLYKAQIHVGFLDGFFSWVFASATVHQAQEFFPHTFTKQTDLTWSQDDDSMPLIL